MHTHHRHLDLLDENNPRSWSSTKKCAIASFVLLSVFVATLGTPIYVAAIPEIALQFHLNSTLAISPTSLYAYGLGIGALVATAACETYGRAIVLRISIPLSFIFTIICACSKNFPTLAIARSLAGLFSGPCLTVGVGVLNDLWDISLEKTGTGFAVLFVLFAIWATQVGPMASAAIIQYYDWTYLFWIPAVMLFVMMICAFYMPETYRPEVERKNAKKAGEEVEPRGVTFAVFMGTVGRPLHMMVVEPIVFPTGLVLAITQSVVFVYYVAYAVLFEQVYGFTQYQVGMAFAPLLAGSLLAIPVVAAFDKLTYQKARDEARAAHRNVAPELRLYPAMLGSILLPASLFWLAWTGKKEINWIWPCLSGALFGLSYVLNMLCLPIYNNDVYTTHFGASTLAAATFMRFTVSASFPLFTMQTIQRLTFPWAVSLLGFITALLIPIPWVFFRWGPKLRIRSRYLRHMAAGKCERGTVKGSIWGGTRSEGTRTIRRGNLVSGDLNLNGVGMQKDGTVTGIGLSGLRKPGSLVVSDFSSRSTLSRQESLAMSDFSSRPGSVRSTDGLMRGGGRDNMWSASRGSDRGGLSMLKEIEIREA